MRLSNRAFFFAIAGTIGFLVDAGVLTALVFIGGDPRPSRLLSFAAAVTVTWLVNRRLAFGDRAAKPSLMEFARYLGASALGAVINLVVYFVLVTYGAPFSTNPVLALAIATSVSMAFNFWIYLSVVFRKRT
jgi:putative flippase GtrA